MSLLLFGDKIKGLKKTAKVADCNEWLYKIHQILVTEPREPHVQPRSLSSF